MSREQLEGVLADLEADLPRLRADYPAPADFWEAFNGLTEVGIDRAEPRDQAWFQEQIQQLVRRHNLNDPQIWQA